MFDLQFLTILDKAISIEEIRKVIAKLKNGKAAGSDKIIPKLLKSFDDNFLSPNSDKFPDEWASGLLLFCLKKELNLISTTTGTLLCLVCLEKF